MILKEKVDMKNSNENAIAEASKREIELLARERGTDSASLAGLMAFKGWTSGKSVSEKEFDAALKSFLSTKAG